MTTVLACDECDDVWLDPARRTLDDALLPDRRTFQIPGTTYYVGGGSAGWSRRGEVERAGWLRYVAGEYDAPTDWVPVQR